MMMFLSMVFSYLQLVVLIVLLVLLILGIVLTVRLIRLTPGIRAVIQAYLEEKSGHKAPPARPAPPPYPYPPMPQSPCAQGDPE